MGQLASFGIEPVTPGPTFPGAKPPRGFALAGLSWIGGALATTAAVALAAVLTIVFAATLAVMLVLVSALVAFCGLALRARGGGMRLARSGGTQTIGRVGHSWVAYGWDRRPR